LYSYNQNGRLDGPAGAGEHGDRVDGEQNFREVKIAYQLSVGTLTAPSGADTAHCSGSDTTLCFVSDPTSLPTRISRHDVHAGPSNPPDGLVTKITDPSGQSWSTS